MSLVSNIVHLRQRYQLKVVLSHIKPPIWRRLVVDSRIPLDVLHDAIQLSMGWEDYHMHQFTDRQGVVYAELPEDEFIAMPGPPVLDEAEILLNEVLNEEKDWLNYEYDFGDGWMHKVILEKVLPHEKNQFPVVCIKGRRACPPEDCGGAWGYQNLLEQLENPGSEEYDELLEWLGEDFNPEKFDLPAINLLLQDIFQDIVFNARPGLENELKRLASEHDEVDSLLDERQQDDFAFNELFTNASELFTDKSELQGVNHDMDAMVRQLLDDKQLPEEIKELLGGMQQMVGMLAYMEELLEQSTDAFEQIRMLSKDKKVISIADKMLMTLDDD